MAPPHEELAKITTPREESSGKDGSSPVGSHPWPWNGVWVGDLKSRV